MNRDQALTATLDELRDARAEMDGWEKFTDYDYHHGKKVDISAWRKNELNIAIINHGSPWRVLWVHPHPPTLDGADSAMPEGWWWSRYETGAEGVKWCAGPRNGFASVYVYDTGNKTADLYRLAVLCWLAEREASK